MSQSKYSELYAIAFQHLINSDSGELTIACKKSSVQKLRVAMQRQKRTHDGMLISLGLDTVEYSIKVTHDTKTDMAKLQVINPDAGDQSEFQILST